MTAIQLDYRMAQKFGGDHTKVKLEKLEEYLKLYLKVLSKQDFRLVFFDAFAGTGDIDISRDEQQQNQLFAQDDYETFISGSAQRALSLPHPFHEYIFVEKSLGKVRQLEELKNRFSHLANRITIKKGDGNAELQKFCKETNWRKTRAVVFLDPFGNQIGWETIELIAATRAIDLWYLFPAGLGVYRQISGDGKTHQWQESSLDFLLGSPEWRTKFIGETQDEGLFGLHKRTQKTATPESVTRYIIERMKKIFAGGVSNHWLPLGSRGVHMYSLLFAVANPDEVAWKLAHRLADAVLKGKKSGRTK